MQFVARAVGTVHWKIGMQQDTAVAEYLHVWCEFVFLGPTPGRKPEA
jgi:hypothetical protein